MIYKKEQDPLILKYSLSCKMIPQQGWVRGDIQNAGFMLGLKMRMCRKGRKTEGGKRVEEEK